MALQEAKQKVLPIAQTPEPSSTAQVMDMLVEQTHEIRHELRQNEKAMRFTDTRLDEQDRGISIKMVPMSLLLPSSSGKSFLFNLIDTPGTWPTAQDPGLSLVCDGCGSPERE